MPGFHFLQCCVSECIDGELVKWLMRGAFHCLYMYPIQFLCFDKAYYKWKYVLGEIHNQASTDNLFSVQQLINLLGG